MLQIRFALVRAKFDRSVGYAFNAFGRARHSVRAELNESVRRVPTDRDPPYRWRRTIRLTHAPRRGSLRVLVGLRLCQEFAMLQDPRPCVAASFTGAAWLRKKAE